MGGFQAVASGLGEGGEQLAQGTNNALNEALKVRSQLFNEQQQTGELNLRQAALQQSYNIAQQQHELARQQMLNSGWVHSGTVLGQDGQYYQTFSNPRTGETSRMAYNGVPPDSPAGQMNYYRSLLNLKGDDGKPMFNDLQAKQVAFKMPQLYREGPVGMMQGFADYAKDNLGITDPNKAQEFAQKQLDIIYGRGGYFRWGAGGLGANHDLTGFTPGEKREYDAAVGPLKLQEQMLTKVMNAQMAATFDPTAQAQISDRFLPAIMQLESQAQSKYQEILSRRNPQAGTQIPDMAKLFAMMGIHMPGTPGGWQVPPGAPSAAGQPNGAKLRGPNNEILAIAENGTWTNPQGR